MSPMVPMKVLGLTLDAENNAPILVLQQDGGSEILPIWIGASEALAISVALNGTRLDRPLTHETMFQAIRALDADIGAVDVIALRDGTYHAELEIVRGKRRCAWTAVPRTAWPWPCVATRPFEWPARCWPKLRPPAPPDAARTW